MQDTLNLFQFVFCIAVFVLSMDIIEHIYLFVSCPFPIEVCKILCAAVWLCSATITGYSIAAGVMISAGVKDSYIPMFHFFEGHTLKETVALGLFLWLSIYMSRKLRKK